MKNLLAITKSPQPSKKLGLAPMRQKDYISTSAVKPIALSKQYRDEIAESRIGEDKIERALHS